MTLTGKLTLVAILPLTLLAVTGGVHVRTRSVAARYDQQSAVVEEIGRAGSDLAFLALEEGVWSWEARPRSQFAARYASLGPVLHPPADLFQTEEQRELLDLLVRSYATIGTLRRELDAALAAHPDGVSETTRAYLTQLQRRLLIETQSMLPRAETLHALCRAEIAAAKDRAATLTLLCLLGLGVSIPALVGFIIRAITTPLAQLHAGMAAVAQAEALAAQASAATSRRLPRFRACRESSCVILFPGTKSGFCAPPRYVAAEKSEHAGRTHPVRGGHIISAQIVDSSPRTLRREEGSHARAILPSAGHPRPHPGLVDRGGH